MVFFFCLLPYGEIYTKYIFVCVFLCPSTYWAHGNFIVNIRQIVSVFFTA